MSIVVQRYIADLSVGDVVNLDSFESEHGPLLRRMLQEEIEALGFVMDSRGILGEVSICSLCSGTGEIKNKACPACDGWSTTVSYGRGVLPYRQ